MKRFWKIAGIATVIAVVGVLALGAFALAQEPEDGAAWPFSFRQRLHEAIAGVLGIGVDEYDAAVDTARAQVLDEAVTEGLLTEEQAELMQDRMEQGFGPGMMGGSYGGWHGRGMMGGGMMGGIENSLLSVAAKELGMTTDELIAELSDGKTIAQVAGERSVDPQAIADAYMAERSAWLADLVAEGRLTQEQADAMLDHMADEILEHMDESMPFGGGPGDCWGDDTGETWQGGPHMRPGGGMRGFPGGGMQDLPGQSDA